MNSREAYELVQPLDPADTDNDLRMRRFNVEHPEHSLYAGPCQWIEFLQVNRVTLLHDESILDITGNNR
jgi:hypothetical protein